MSTKRKVAAEAVPSPKEKRVRSSTTASAKKRLHDDTIDHHQVVKQTKKKKSADITTNEAKETSTSNEQDYSTATTPKRGRPPKTDSIKIVKTPKLTMEEKLAIKRLNGGKLLRTPILTSSSQFSVVTTPKSWTPVQSEPSRSDLDNVQKYLDPPKFKYVAVAVDEEQSINFWDQTWEAMTITFRIIGPLLVGLSVLCYVISMLCSDPQPVASIGISFFLTLCIVFAAFAASIIPLTLLSKLFTDLVTSSLDENAKWAFKRDSYHITTFIALAVLFGMTSVMVYSMF